MDPHFFSQLLLDQQKDGYLFSFLEVVRTFVICHMLQLVVWLLFGVVVVIVIIIIIIVVAVAAAVVVLLLLLLLPSSSFSFFFFFFFSSSSSSSTNLSSTSLASAPDSKSVSVTRISLMASFLSLIFSWPLLNTYNGLPYLDSFLWLGTVAETKGHEDMSFFHNDSKTDLQVLCDVCIKFLLFEGAQDVFSRLTAECCMLLPHNPYRVPQHYKRHVCGPSCSCEHWFLWISLIFEH